MPDEINDIISSESSIFIDFIDDNRERLIARLQLREPLCKLISIHHVDDEANHRMVSNRHPRGRKCNQSLRGPGYVLVWAKK